MKFADRVARANCGNGCVKDMIAMQADATIAAKDAEIASLRDRLRDTAQILIAEVGATGPADAEGVARKAVSQIARLREALNSAHALLDEAATDPAGQYYFGLRCGVEDRDIRDRYEAAEYGWQKAFEYVDSVAANAARAALAQAAEVGNG